MPAAAAMTAPIPAMMADGSTLLGVYQSRNSAKAMLPMANAASAAAQW